MTIQEMLAGESKNVEFKVSRPADRTISSEMYYEGAGRVDARCND